jgi:hypothetical protein
MSQFEEIPSPGRGFQGSRALGGLAACKTLASTALDETDQNHWLHRSARRLEQHGCDSSRVEAAQRAEISLGLP